MARSFAFYVKKLFSNNLFIELNMNRELLISYGEGVLCNHSIILDLIELLALRVFFIPHDLT